METHSWSTVKIDRLGLMFFWKHVLERDWQWLDIVKPPKVKSIPDILTPTEVERLICATKKLRYPEKRGPSEKGHNYLPG